MLAVLVAGCAQPVPVAPAQAPAASGGGEAAAGTAGAASGEIVNGGTWTEASGSDASNFNPILYDDSVSSVVVGYVYPGLIATDPKTGQFTSDFGAMAESWTVSDDGLIYTFKLATASSGAMATPSTRRTSSSPMMPLTPIRLSPAQICLGRHRERRGTRSADGRREVQAGQVRCAGRRGLGLAAEPPIPG